MFISALSAVSHGDAVRLIVHELYCHEYAVEYELESARTPAERVAVNEKLESNKS
jgi:hypothetical protein